MLVSSFKIEVDPCDESDPIAIESTSVEVVFQIRNLNLVVHHKCLRWNRTDWHDLNTSGI
jgi:hypothetical protein